MPDAGPRPPAAGGVAQERRTTPVELLWDLVFVFAITQVSTLLAHHLTWEGFGESMLVLAMVLIFITGLALPEAFRDDATLFAATYAGVRFLHLALYADASRRGNASWAAIAGFGVPVAIGMALLVAGSFLDGWARIVLWTLAAAIDYAGPALTRERLRGIQQVAVAHFAERYASAASSQTGQPASSIA